MNDEICQGIIDNNENNDDINIVDADNELIFCQQNDANILHQYHHTAPTIISPMATKTNNKTMKYFTPNSLLNNSLIICLLLFSIVTLIVDARPIRSSASTFCQKPTNILQVYNIGRDVYLALNSRSIYRFDVDRLEVSETRFDLNRLFGTSKCHIFNSVNF